MGCEEAGEIEPPALGGDQQGCFEHQFHFEAGGRTRLRAARMSASKSAASSGVRWCRFGHAFASASLVRRASGTGTRRASDLPSSTIKAVSPTSLTRASNSGKLLAASVAVTVFSVIHRTIGLQTQA